MVRIAVTGGIACGKSLVGSFLSEEGVPVCDADDLAHDSIRRGQPAYSEVVRVFGTGILNPDREIDRKRLGKRVFLHPAELKRLNAIIHPRVRKVWEKWLRDHEARSAAAVVIPLLYEADAAEGWSAVICVSASEALQAVRLKRRGISGRNATLRIRAQMPVSVKAEKADFVVVNSWTKDVLREQVRRVLKRIAEK